MTCLACCRAPARLYMHMHKRLHACILIRVGRGRAAGEVVSEVDEESQVRSGRQRQRALRSRIGWKFKLEYTALYGTATGARSSAPCRVGRVGPQVGPAALYEI